VQVQDEQMADDAITTLRAILGDQFGRIRELVTDLTDGLTDQAGAYRPDPDANSVDWLVWHASRVQDDHLAGITGGEQVWTANGWYEAFGLPFAPEVHGYGHSSADVGAVRVAADLLDGYHADVHAATMDYVGSLTVEDLDRVVDRNWDPPVTAAVRLVSVIGDVSQHLGQAAYVRGLAQRAGIG
jgi:hypothetical protein